MARLLSAYVTKIRIKLLEHSLILIFLAYKGCTN